MAASFCMHHRCRQQHPWYTARPGPPSAGRNLAGRLREPATFPTPLFYMWPPGPDGSPYLGAAHGLMGEAFVSAANHSWVSWLAAVMRRPQGGARQRQPALLLLARQAVPGRSTRHDW